MANHFGVTGLSSQADSGTVEQFRSDIHRLFKEMKTTIEDYNAYIGETEKVISNDGNTEGLGGMSTAASRTFQDTVSAWKKMYEALSETLLSGDVLTKVDTQFSYMDGNLSVF